MDFSNVKKITISAGEVKQIEIDGVVVWKGGYTNLVPTSIDTDGSIYNGCGYKDNSRLSSGGSIKEQSNTCASGLIPATNGEPIRITGCYWNINRQYGDTYTYIGFYDANKKWIGSWNNYKTNNGYPAVENCLVSKETDTIYRLEPTVSTPYAYVRLSLYGKGEDMVITVNEEIEE